MTASRKSPKVDAGKTAKQKSNLALRLAAVRKRAGLSLNEVSALTGISRSTLYKVENSGVSLTYDKLVDLSRGLGVDVEEFFRTDSRPPKDIVVMGRCVRDRLGASEPFDTRAYETRYLCGQFRQKRMVPCQVRIKAHSIEEFGELPSHPGEEFDLVLEGEIEFHTAFYEPIRLAKGEAIYIDSAMPHGMISVSDEDALVLTIATGPDKE
ncbi:MAG: helix-turn-helix domain-containing protein [Parvularculaceae bacterium]